MSVLRGDSVGESQSIHILLLVLLFGALRAEATPQSSRVTVSFEPASVRVSGTLILTPIGQSAAEKRIAVTGAPVVFDLPSASEWQIECECDSVWAPPTPLKVSRGSVFAIVSVRRTYPVRGTVKADGRIDAITMSIESPPQPKKPPEIPRGTQFQCPVSGEDSFTCQVPIGTHDVSVRAKGFTPLYRWDVIVGRDQGADLGTLTFRKGASVMAWLAKEHATTLKKPAHATLTRVSTSDASPVTARLQRPVAESDFDRRGYVQLAPLPAGLYVLEVTAAGFAPARVHPIEVFEGAESKLSRAIELARPITLRIAIDPPRDPSGSPWRVTLERQSDFSAAADPRPIPTTFDAAGTLIVRDLAPGRFRIEVQDRSGNSLVWQDLSVTDERDAEQRLTVPLLRVEGTVDVPATLTFGTESGAVRVRMTSNDEGGFEGYLPRGGSWDVELRSRDATIQTVRKVEVKEGERIRLRLGSRSLRGVVLDPDGRRAPNAQVMLVTDNAESAVTTRTDQLGEWQFRGVDSGKFFLRARDQRGASSDAFRGTLSENEQRSDIELRLQGSRSVTGRVTAGGTPVPGARVSMIGLGPGQGSGRSAVSDVDGAFSLQVAENVTYVLAIVGAPSRSLRAFQTQLSNDPLEFKVDSTGGTINLKVPETASDFWLAQDGVVIPLQDLLTWAAGYGRSFTKNDLTIPFMAAAKYRFCARPSSTARPVCAEQFLAPNGTIVLAP